MNSSNQPVSVKLDSDLRARIQQLATARERSVHWMLRAAIRQYVEVEEKREKLRQDALRGWEEYQVTGLHATAEEVETWLGSWFTAQELPAPKCRR